MNKKFRYVQRRSPKTVFFGSILMSIAILSSTSIGQDKGLNTPLSNLKNKFADLLSQAEKKIPRSQKYQILNTVRHRLKAGKQKDDAAQLIDLANQYKRYRFYPEAIQLFEEVAANSSNADEYLMMSNRWLGEIKFVADDDVKASIRHFNKALTYSPKDSQARGYLLGRLGSYYFIDGQTNQMLSAFEKFNQLPKRVKILMPDSHLKANLYSARFTTDKEASAKLFEKAREIALANPREFPPDMVLSIFSEQNSKLPWNSEERINRLLKLVKNKAYADEPKIREYALEVLMAYFLEREKEWDRFEKFAKTAKDLLLNFKTKDTSTYSLGSQAIGIYVGAAELAKQKWNKDDWQNEFQQWYGKAKPISHFFPSKITRNELQEIMKAFRLGESLLSKKKKAEQPKKRK